MNPWAFLVILLALIIIIIGVRGTQHNVVSAITGKAYVPPSSSSGGNSSAAGTASGVFKFITGI